MVRKKKPTEFCVDMSTGKIQETVRITRETVNGINQNLEEMSAIIRAVSEWRHDKAADRLIETFMAKALGE